MNSPDFSLFIHALATELDLQAGEEESNALLNSVGSRMATRLPLPECRTMGAFELECNAILALIGWGRAELEIEQGTGSFQIRLHDMPRVGALGSPAGFWFSALYEGLFTGWFAQIGEAVVIRVASGHTGESNLLLLTAEPERH